MRGSAEEVGNTQSDQFLRIKARERKSTPDRSKRIQIAAVMLAGIAMTFAFALGTIANQAFASTSVTSSR